MFEIIITGLGELLGFEIVVFIALMFSFFIMLISRGAGVTSMIATFFLSAYLFANKSVGDYFLLSQEWFLTIVVLTGLMIGFIIYFVFLKE